MNRTPIITLLTAATLSATTAFAGPANQVFDVPRLSGIAIDGSLADWAEDGLRIEVVTTPEGDMRPARDLDVAFRLGWDGEGLLVAASVRDDAAVEADALDHLWQRDCVELFVARSVGSNDRYQVVVAPGIDEDHPETRHRIYDHRPDSLRTTPLRATTVCAPLAGGYVLEALLPWRNLGIRAAPDVTLAFQLLANDDDGNRGNDGPCRVAWFPAIGAHIDGSLMHRIRLASRPSAPVLSRVDRTIGLNLATIRIHGAASLIGATAEVRSRDICLAHGALGMCEGRSGAVFHIAPPGDPWIIPALEVHVGGDVLSLADSPTLAQVLARYQEALGGRAAHAPLITRQCEGRYEEYLGYQDSPRRTIPFAGAGQAPDRWRVSFASDDFPYIEGSDGTVAWCHDHDGVHISDHTGESALALCAVPGRLLSVCDHLTNLSLVGPRHGAPDGVYVVEGVNESGHSQTLWFDTHSSLLTRLGHWELQDYRMVDGILLPHRLVTTRRGGWSAYELDLVGHNAPVDPALFSAPDPEVTFPDVFGGISDARVLPLLEHLPYHRDGMNIPPADGRLLYDLVVDQGYRRGLEIGTSNGYSSLWLGLAFRQTGGSLVTIEIEPEAALDARRNFRTAGLNDLIDVRINDAFDEIPRLEGEFDFVFIDAWKPDYARLLELVRDRVSPGGAIAAHNVTSHSHDMDDFLSAIQGDPNLQTSFHTGSSAGLSVSLKQR